MMYPYCGGKRPAEPDERPNCGENLTQLPPQKKSPSNPDSSFEAPEGGMRKQPEKICLVCGKAKGTCLRCQAERGHRGLFGIPVTSWLSLLLGVVIALMLWVG